MSETVAVCSEGFILFGWLVVAVHITFPTTHPHTSKQKAYQLQTFLSLSSSPPFPLRPSPSPSSLQIPPLYRPTQLSACQSIHPLPSHISLPPSSNSHLPSSTAKPYKGHTYVHINVHVNPHLQKHHHRGNIRHTHTHKCTNTGDLDIA